MRKIFLLLFIAGFCFTNTYAQDNDFCDGVNTIIRDGANKFRNTRSTMLNAGSDATIWATGVKVPGTISSRFVATTMGLFYEGAFMQTKNKDQVKAVYLKYKLMLKDCLTKQGYVLLLEDNFYPGMSEYKKLAFMPAIKDDAKPGTTPPHITMEVTYSKSVGFYTVVMYIFEH